MCSFALFIVIIIALLIILKFIILKLVLAEQTTKTSDTDTLK